VICHFLNNHRPYSSPVSIFLTDATPLIIDKGRKHYAERICYSYFELPLNHHALPSWAGIKKISGTAESL
jgi:hypothetical protein